MKKQKRKKTSDNQMIAEMKIKRIKNELLTAILGSSSALGLATISLIPFPDEQTPKPVSWIINALVLLFFLFGFVSILLIIKNYNRIVKYKKNYHYYVESKRITTALLTATKRTDFAKTYNILQSTYNNVNKWHPIDYCQNILVYDVHQHIRDLCIQLKELIVSLVPDELTDDMVTVDLVYEYPSEKEFEKKALFEDCCIINNQTQDADENVSPVKEGELNLLNWKVITSGDHTSSSVNLHMYLNASNSFYSHLCNQGYVFGNDKKDLEKANHYIWSTKDREHSCNGSIVGVVVELKNDAPEIVFIRAYLTITTYGRKLVEETDILNESQFEKLLKETVINCYKTRIESEFAQMFVRHGIKEGYINRRTGEIYTKK